MSQYSDIFLIKWQNALIYSSLSSYLIYIEHLPFPLIFHIVSHLNNKSLKIYRGEYLAYHIINKFLFNNGDYHFPYSNQSIL